MHAQIFVESVCFLNNKMAFLQLPQGWKSLSIAVASVSPDYRHDVPLVYRIDLSRHAACHLDINRSLCIYRTVVHASGRISSRSRLPITVRRSDSIPPEIRRSRRAIWESDVQDLAEAIQVKAPFWTCSTACDRYVDSMPRGATLSAYPMRDAAAAMNSPFTIIHNERAPTFHQPVNSRRLILLRGLNAQYVYFHVSETDCETTVMMMMIAFI